MDELDLLNRALPGARPPSPEVVARARARVRARERARERVPRRRVRAWRAAGSPAEITVACGDGGPCGQVSTKKGHNCAYDRTGANGLLSGHGFARLTVADLAALPTGRDALMAWLRDFHKAWAGRGSKPAFDEFLPVASNLLAAPIGPAQRAALIRLLAASPHVKVVGEVTRPLGGKGLALDFGELDHVFDSRLTPAKFPYQRRIVDLSTGRWLADVTYQGRAIGGVAKGAPLMFAARHVSTGWAEGPPVPPKGCKALKLVG